ncbi:MAG TPA: hypothetical protein PLC98_24945 [Anaerolineales bacterium]|nr:hypothetical protein [Anaerolineales bacterium]
MVEGAAAAGAQEPPALRFDGVSGECIVDGRPVYQSRWFCLGWLGAAKPNHGMQLTWLIGTQIRLGRLAVAPSGGAGWLIRHAADARALGGLREEIPVRPNVLNRRQMAIGFAAMLILAGSSIALFRRDVVWLVVPIPADAETYVNKAQICVQAVSNDRGAIFASVRPEGNRCLSSSCTEIYLDDANVVVSQLTYSLHFNSGFAFRDITAERGVCRTDCMAVRGKDLQLGPLWPGYYSVWLGTTWLGQIEVQETGVPVGRGCVSSSQPAAFLPVATPTERAQPQSYPAPILTENGLRPTLGYP